MDISGTEQLSLGVRFYDKKEKVIKEDFLEQGLGAENIARAITDTFPNWSLNLELTVGRRRIRRL